MSLTIEELNNKAEINAERIVQFTKQIEEYKNKKEEIKNEMLEMRSIDLQNARANYIRAINEISFLPGFKQKDYEEMIWEFGNSINDKTNLLEDAIHKNFEQLRSQDLEYSNLIMECEEAIEHSKKVLNKIIEICEENIEVLKNEKDKSNKSKQDLKPLIERYAKLTEELDELQELKEEGIVTRKDIARIEEIEKAQKEIIGKLNNELPDVKKMLEKSLYEDLTKDDSIKNNETDRKIKKNEELIKDINEFIEDFKKGKKGITINPDNIQNNVEKEQLEDKEKEELEEIQRKITDYIETKKIEKEEAIKQETNDNKDINVENNPLLEKENVPKNEFKIIKETELSHADKQEVEDILSINSFDPTGKTEELNKIEPKKKNNYEKDILDIFSQTNMNINSHNRKTEKEPVVLTPSSKVKMRNDLTIEKPINNNEIDDYLNLIKTDSRTEQIGKKVKKNVPKEKKQGIFKRAYENIKYYFFGTEENIEKWEKEELEKNKNGRTR